MRMTTVCFISSFSVLKTRKEKEKEKTKRNLISVFLLVYVISVISVVY